MVNRLSHSSTPQLSTVERYPWSAYSTPKDLVLMKCSHKYLNILFGLPNSLEEGKLTLILSSFLSGGCSSTCRKWGQKARFLSAPRTPFWLLPQLTAGTRSYMWPREDEGFKNLLLSLEEYFSSWFSSRSVYPAPSINFCIPILTAQTQGERSVPTLIECAPEILSLVRGEYTTIASHHRAHNKLLKTGLSHFSFLIFRQLLQIKAGFVCFCFPLSEPSFIFECYRYICSKMGLRGQVNEVVF